eukprot:CAMPEP_0174853504 /NCGR_PEP_ID=MMETSP1114-20130205/28749_1 /TAXON_ID=312471 /ORGANISM="Neobodo designis, Strain CCAP 1951/1" /LENGTH=612 /DNA_ID=CAMNT_0016088159 /DNA_START=106 /DNA_END=1944 /DNA_ORIENTATION=-
MLRRAIQSHVRPAAAVAGVRAIHTDPAQRLVVPRDMHVEEMRYPTVFKGLTYTTDIFGVAWPTKAQQDLLTRIWNRDCFLPTKPAAALTGTPFAVISDIASQQAIELKDGGRGLVAKNELRSTVRRLIVEQESEKRLFDAFLGHLRSFEKNPTDEGAQLISNVAFWCQWLIRGVLFEGKIHDQKFTDAVVPAPLSTLAFAANAALGRHQIEFVYDDYTLKAANFPTHRTFEDVDYNDPADILKFIAEIDTPVGFVDMAGGKPEHNFRHNHSLMEQQMRRAFIGWEKMQDKNIDGDGLVAAWADIAVAAERSHRVFNTMMTNTPADSYPLIRLPIKGVRGACGNVFPPNGVFYEGCGTQPFQMPSDSDAAVAAAAKDGADLATMTGAYVDREFGQTGANSSMYKWLDIFVGVTKQRSAYALTPAQRDKMRRVVRGEDDAGSLGENPIDSMQRAFDLLTRPAVHLHELATVAEKVETGPFLHHKSDPRLKDLWELAAFERFQAAFYVASHRNVHGKYVLKMIYQTKPVGGQSRAEGTGGSTPPFLKTFFDQTFGPAMTLSDELLRDGRPEVLGSARLDTINAMRAQLEREMQAMTRVQQKGLELEKAERASAHA